MYPLGFPTTVVIDDILPFDKTRDDFMFLKAAKDGSVWGPLVEKAFAKINGNYATLAAGLPTESIGYLTGAPGLSLYPHDYVPTNMLWDHLWKLQTKGKAYVAAIT